MNAVDWTHLTAFEEEWVALDKQDKVLDHSKTLAAIRNRLGDAAKNFSYFFVPSPKLGISV